MRQKSPFLFYWVPLSISHSVGKVTNTNTNFIAVTWCDVTYAFKCNSQNCYPKLYLDNE